MERVELPEHPLLEAEWLAVDLPRPLGELSTPAEVLALLKPGAVGPFSSDEALRGAVRDLLRFGGFKPTGRSKPASEYLIRAVGASSAASRPPSPLPVDSPAGRSGTGGGDNAFNAAPRAGEGTLGSINLAVDVCNAASLHSGLPISVVDLDCTRPPLRIALAPAGASYVFNAGGQTLDLGGLLCLFDADGPCANAVKDSQRTKTSPGTRRILAVIWGTRARPGLARRVADWYRSELPKAW